MTKSGSWWRRFTSTAAELDAEEMRRSSVERGADVIEDVAPGQMTTLNGVLHSVLYSAEDRLPVLEADLFDGSGHVDVKWIGRRRIRGIEPGVALSVTGRLVTCDGRLTIFNPVYTLLPRGGAG